MQREFKRKGHCVARVRVQFPGAKQPTNNVVQERMHDRIGRDLIEGMMILAAVQRAESICLGMEAFVVMCDRCKPHETQLNLEIAAERRIHTHPRRRECLMVAYQMPDKEIQAMAIIEREPTRLGKWMLTETLAGHYDEFLAKHPNAESKFGFVFQKAQQANKVEWIARLLARAIKGE